MCATRPVAAGLQPRRLALAVLLGVVAAAHPAAARPAGEAALQAVSSHLRAAIDGTGRGAARAALTRRRPDGTVPFELRFTVLTPAVVAAIRALGARVEHVSYRYARVAAVAPPERLAELAALPGVAVVHPQYGAVLNAGSVASQGDAPVRGEEARALGFDGTGVRVGLLSDTFNRRLGGTISGGGCERVVRGAAPQDSGDLPETVVVLTDGPLQGGDEGAALGEIVHDLAPGAALLFASAFSTEATFAEAIDDLVACGADVLVDDVIYFAEPMFQDGIIAQAAQAAVEADVPFFSAVGNHGTGGILASFTDADPTRGDENEPPSGDDLHDFGGGRRFAPITVDRNCGVRFVLQWDDPFSGSLGAGAATDLDLYVTAGESLDTLLASSVDTQGCARHDGGPGGDPFEFVQYNNTTGGPRTVYVAIDHFCGQPGVTFRLVTFPTCMPERYTFDPAIFTGPQIYGHVAAPGVIATAAVFFADAGDPGAAVEPFSARGGHLPIVFDAGGLPLPGGPVLRFKPDLTGPDGVNSTFFGSDSARDPDSLPNFSGTSAAAPHAAAIAALIRQAAPELSAAAITTALRETAVDMDSPGRDDRAGDGFVDAFAALTRALELVSETPTEAPDTATPTATPEPPTPTTTPAGPPAAGDCNGDGSITVDELVTGVRIALGEAVLASCGSLDRDGDGQIGVADLVHAVRAALAGPAISRAPVRG